jgi:hypothetical protein
MAMTGRKALATLILPAFVAACGRPAATAATAEVRDISDGAPLAPPGDARANDGSAPCPLRECFRAIECVERCGGPVVAAGCCPCPPGTVDLAIACPRQP